MYNDLISREALRKCAIPCQIHNGALTDLCVPLYQIDIAPIARTTDKQDLAVADKLDTFVSKLNLGDDVSSGRMSKEEYIEIVSSLRYAISKLRGGKK